MDHGRAHGSCSALSFRAHDRLELSGGALDVVVDDHVVELVGLLRCSRGEARAAPRSRPSSRSPARAGAARARRTGASTKIVTAPGTLRRTLRARPRSPGRGGILPRRDPRDLRASVPDRWPHGTSARARETRRDASFSSNSSVGDEPVLAPVLLARPTCRVVAETRARAPASARAGLSPGCTLEKALLAQIPGARARSGGPPPANVGKGRRTAASTGSCRMRSSTRSCAAASFSEHVKLPLGPAVRNPALGDRAHQQSAVKMLLLDLEPIGALGEVERTCPVPSRSSMEAPSSRRSSGRLRARATESTGEIERASGARPGEQLKQRGRVPPRDRERRRRPRAGPGSRK